ncbi:hypothetical protein BT93_E1192 [Corymbia citriodora subsp. variegata]|nr:hypothetical protein BT93_E1192 [Corymbia citriodora subsp. variegata]
MFFHNNSTDNSVEDLMMFLSNFTVGTSKRVWTLAVYEHCMFFHNNTGSKPTNSSMQFHLKKSSFHFPPSIKNLTAKSWEIICSNVFGYFLILWLVGSDSNRTVGAYLMPH